MSATSEGWYPPPIPPPPGGSGPAIPEPPGSGRRSGLMALAFVFVAVAAGGAGLIIGRVTAPKNSASLAAPVMSTSPTSGFADDEQAKVSVEHGQVTSPEATFSYPSSWAEVPSSSKPTAGLRRWAVRLEPENGGNFVVVYADNSAFDGTALPEAEAKLLVGDRAKSFADSVSGTVSGDPLLQHPGAEWFWGSEITWTSHSTGQTADLFFSFHRHLLIEVYCQSDTAHAQAISQGCSQVLQSFDVTSD